MPFLALLKSPKIIGTLVGVLAFATLGALWWARGKEIETLEARIAVCRQQRADVVATNDRLAEAIRVQNEATRERVRQAEQVASDQAALAEQARIDAEDADRRLSERLASIDRTTIPESVEERLAQCDTARSYLVR